MRVEKVKIPVVGLTVETGELIEWHVSVGDEVSKGTELCTIEFEKVDFVVESPSSGRVAELFIEAGTEVVPGMRIMAIEVPD